MKKKQINTGKAEILLVEFPDGANPKIFDNGLWLYYKNGDSDFNSLPKGNWSILSRADEVTEVVAKGIVRMPNDNGYFFDYVYDPDDSYSQIESALESLDSLYDANEVYWENPVKHPKQMNMTPASFSWYISQVERHEQAQKNVWDKSRTYILIKQK